MTGEEWLAYGLAQGWVGPVVCSTHDGVPMTDAEADDHLDGGEPCIWVLRVYADDDERQAVERDHAPSQWRKPPA